MLFEPPDNNDDGNNNRSNKNPKPVTPNPLVSQLSFERQLQVRVILDQIGTLTVEKPLASGNDKEVVEYSGFVRLEEADVVDYQNAVKDILTSLLLQNFELRDAYLKELSKGIIN